VSEEEYTGIKTVDYKDLSHLLSVKDDKKIKDFYANVIYPFL
jgi:hypothetical protein